MDTNQHQRYMSEAMREASAALARGEVPVGAVVVCQDRIIARAHNLSETLTDPTAHAEMQVITAAASYIGGKYLNECTLFVTLEPCLMCAGALAWSQLGTLVYGAGDPKKGYSSVCPKALHPKTRVVKGVMEHECSEIVSSFFRKIRRSK